MKVHCFAAHSMGGRCNYLSNLIKCAHGMWSGIFLSHYEMTS